MKNMPIRSWGTPAIFSVVFGSSIVKNLTYYCLFGWLKALVDNIKNSIIRECNMMSISSKSLFVHIFYKKDLNKVKSHLKERFELALSTKDLYSIKEDIENASFKELDVKSIAFDVGVHSFLSSSLDMSDTENYTDPETDYNTMLHFSYTDVISQKSPGMVDNASKVSKLFKEPSKMQDELLKISSNQIIDFIIVSASFIAVQNTARGDLFKGMKDMSIFSIILGRLSIDVDRIKKHYTVCHPPVDKISKCATDQVIISGKSLETQRVLESFAVSLAKIPVFGGCTTSIDGLRSGWSDKETGTIRAKVKRSWGAFEKDSIMLYSTKTGLLHEQSDKDSIVFDSLGDFSKRNKIEKLPDVLMEENLELRREAPKLLGNFDIPMIAPSFFDDNFYNSILHIIALSHNHFDIVDSKMSKELEKPDFIHDDSVTEVSVFKYMNKDSQEDIRIILNNESVIKIEKSGNITILDGENDLSIKIIHGVCVAFDSSGREIDLNRDKSTPKVTGLEYKNKSGFCTSRVQIDNGIVELYQEDVSILKRGGSEIYANGDRKLLDDHTIDIKSLRKLVKSLSEEPKEYSRKTPRESITFKDTVCKYNENDFLSIDGKTILIRKDDVIDIFGEWCLEPASSEDVGSILGDNILMSTSTKISRMFVMMSSEYAFLEDIKIDIPTATYDSAIEQIEINDIFRAVCKEEVLEIRNNFDAWSKIFEKFEDFMNSLVKDNDDQIRELDILNEIQSKILKSIEGANYSSDIRMPIKEKLSTILRNRSALTEHKFIITEVMHRMNTVMSILKKDKDSRANNKETVKEIYSNNRLLIPMMLTSFILRRSSVPNDLNMSGFSEEDYMIRLKDLLLFAVNEIE